jgi:hypothetical protein
MRNEYAYAITQCDVPVERRGALQSFRDKRRLWVSWLDADEHHAIWKTLSDMVWTDVAFKTLTGFAVGNDENALNNPLVVEALLNGHVATQVLAIRRLTDKGKQRHYLTAQTSERRQAQAGRHDPTRNHVDSRPISSPYTSGQNQTFGTRLNGGSAQFAAIR